jgi:hypothetical protein
VTKTFPGGLPFAVGGSLLLFLRRCGHAFVVAATVPPPVPNINIT